MRAVLKELIKEKNKLEQVGAKAERELNNIKVKNKLKDEIIQKEKIRVDFKHNTPQFYIKNEETNSRYKYIPASESTKYKKIVESNYYEKVYESVCDDISCINRLIKRIEENSWDEIYCKLGRGRRKIITPIQEPIEQFRERWKNEKYEGKEFHENDAMIYSENGERVRSKSEKIIADKLFKENVLYRYEYPFQTNYSGIIYPDFTILDEVRRRNIIYEHFGLMDNPEYANNAVGKIQLYMNHGYVLGDNLFISMETSAIPFDGRVLDGIIKQIKN